MAVFMIKGLYMFPQLLFAFLSSALQSMILSLKMLSFLILLTMVINLSLLRILGVGGRFGHGAQRYLTLICLSIFFVGVALAMVIFIFIGLLCNSYKEISQCFIFFEIVTIAVIRFAWTWPLALLSKRVELLSFIFDSNLGQSSARPVVAIVHKPLVRG